ncbi:MAG TPA: hypothetical protein ENF95_01340 [Candidatus Aenigmarchaeota archaeon]|nr:hypothetical protein [Candidatus Aenigmarchaeota archaeon]
MKLVCETMAQHVIPSIRALIARDLIEVYKMTQREAAKRLGMTQPAVSQYKKHVRGKKARFLEHDKKISKKISELSKALAKNEITEKEFKEEICKICKYIKESNIFSFD